MFVVGNWKECRYHLCQGGRKGCGQRVRSPSLFIPPRCPIDASISAALMRGKLSLSSRRSKDSEETPSPSAGTSVLMTSRKRFWTLLSPITESSTTLLTTVRGRCPRAFHCDLRMLVGSCAAGFTYDKMIHTLPDDAWDVIQKIHVRAPFRLIRAAAPYMRIKVRDSASSCICRGAHVVGSG